MCFEVDLGHEKKWPYNQDYLNIYHYIMRGPFDDTLEWPFNKFICIRVLNHKRNDSFYYEYDYKFLPDKGARVIGGNIGELFFRRLESQLPKSSLTNGYLKNDTLQFMVTIS